MGGTCFFSSFSSNETKVFFFGEAESSVLSWLFSSNAPIPLLRTDDFKLELMRFFIWNVDVLFEFFNKLKNYMMKCRKSTLEKDFLFFELYSSFSVVLINLNELNE